jgi:small conductance mechanosensitive channel
MLRSATLKIGASGSWLTAIIVSAPDIPAMCWTAPEMPKAMYILGVTDLPLSPTWAEYGTQPRSTAMREAPTVPPRSLARLVMHFIIFMVVAGALGIQVTSLVAILSVAGLAISLSIQNLLSNVLSGLMLLSIKPFKVGDYIEVGGVGGTVKEIGFVHTKMLTIENIMIYIPNSDVSSSKITNYSTQDKRRFNLKINVSYDCPPEKVRKVLLDYISAHPKIDRDPAPFVAVSDYKENCIEYVVRAWADNSIFWDVYWDLYNGLDDLFKKNGIAFTYPNLNVHIKQ